MFYCGRECQRKDWKSHKNQCKCYKITKDQSLHGNHVVAARLALRRSSKEHGLILRIKSPSYKVKRHDI